MSLPVALKVVPDWFLTNKIVDILNKVVFSNNDIDFNYIDPDIITLFCDDIGINTININIINLDGNDDNIETMINVKLVTWRSRYKQCITFK